MRAPEKIFPILLSFIKLILRFQRKNWSFSENFH